MFFKEVTSKKWLWFVYGVSPATRLYERRVYLE